jgi:hypothetical protein
MYCAMRETSPALNASSIFIRISSPSVLSCAAEKDKFGESIANINKMYNFARRISLMKLIELKNT